ncbi:MAG: class I SAM-dependent methyltransferase [Sedimentisphaerales bacterium]|nr:class I SAM-dependent methyltransferase [Sedimentisphaerales bacterium]
MAGYREIDKCRISGTKNLVSVLNLGFQELTGVFPRKKAQPLTSGPLELVWCPDSGLLQLKHSYESSEMYGENYGYRSGINQSMVDHLTEKIHSLERLVPLKNGDIVLDIGSNDATALKAYSTAGIKRIGIDPTGRKFAPFYPPEIRLIPDFFSEKAYLSAEKKPAKIITSIAMFYDLEQPVEFARQVASVLAEDGVWHFEQSYMPSMLRMNSYDTICHEHLEYYSLGVMDRILEAAGLVLVDVVMNAINGGSFAVTAAKKSNKAVRRNRAVIDWLLAQENRMGLNTPRPYRDFEERVFKHKDDLTRLIHSLVADGKKILGYGASTKGNVVLQFCGLTAKEIPAIADVNPDKLGCFTPGTRIPIISEKEARKMEPDYFFVLPWHFKDGILRREKEFLSSGGRMIFPFPEIEIV